MSLLDSLLSGLAGGSPQGSNSQGSNSLGPLLQIAMQLLAGADTSGASSGASAGGLGALIEQFQRAGMGAQMNSWISAGQNMPISAEQLMQVFGHGQMQQMAANSGMSVDEMSGGLAGMLPQLIDHLTPGGQVPAAGIDSALADLSRMMPR
ncbi:MAG TPA: YidB family protein [Burkholderiaceae bacterium]|nr:YidB family protein [Burkholderiaceae bacterium]